MKKRLLSYLAAVLMLTGCASRQPDQPVKTVNQIQIQYESTMETICRTYDAPEKMTEFLNSLRLLEQAHGPKNPPVDLLGPRWYIALQFSDGTRKRYLIQSDRYLCSDCRGWKSVDEGRARKLYALLREMPGDQLSQKGSGHSPHLPTRDLNCSS